MLEVLSNAGAISYSPAAVCVLPLHQLRKNGWITERTMVLAAVALVWM